MYNTTTRDSAYTSQLSAFIKQKYGLNTQSSITPAKRGYYGETWRLDVAEKSYFLKLDYFPRHRDKFKNSLPVIDYLCENDVDFIGKIIKTADGELCGQFHDAVIGVFEWIDGENIETDETKTLEYQLLCKIYPLTKQGFNIPTMAFSDEMANRFYEMWDALKAAPSTESNDDILALLERQSERLSHCAKRLSYFASVCQSDMSGFYITHGDAGGNFFVGNNRNYIVD